MLNKDIRSAWEKLYRNFDDSFREILLHPILGEDYYNAGMNSLACDTESCKDLKYKFDSINKQKKIWRFIAIINFIIILAFIISKM